jgi:hypothetical protein
MRRYSIVIIGLVIILAGCSQALQDDLDSGVATILADEQSLVIETTLQAVPDSSPKHAKETFELETSPEPLTNVAPNLEPLIALAIVDLAERLDIAPAEITLVSAEAVVWPDASLGCPQPDMLYQQVQEDGTLIVLRVADRDYAYHSGSGREPFLCEQDEPQKYPLIKPTKGIYHPP